MCASSGIASSLAAAAGNPAGGHGHVLIHDEKMLAAKLLFRLSDWLRNVSEGMS